MIAFALAVLSLGGIAVYAALKMIQSPRSVRSPQPQSETAQVIDESMPRAETPPTEYAADIDDADAYPRMPPSIAPQNLIDSLFVKYGTIYNVEPRLLKAIARVESSLNPNAIRNNPPHDVSIGLMQILCLPGKDGTCTNKFNIDRWNEANAASLLDPDLNIALGAQILAWNIRAYGYMRGIAVYNSWGARNDPPNGPFRNQGYVDKVMKFYNQQ